MTKVYNPIIFILLNLSFYNYNYFNILINIKLIIISLLFALITTILINEIINFILLIKFKKILQIKKIIKKIFFLNKENYYV